MGKGLETDQIWKKWANAKMIRLYEGKCGKAY